MAVEITIIKEDIKKDLTNFLIGIASAGISEDVFPQLAEMITKALSPTLDVALFADNLVELLKQGNDIKENNGVDFAALIESIQKGSPFLDAQGDSIFISSVAESEPRPHSEITLEHPLNINSDNKDQDVILNDRAEPFAPTSDVEGKEELEIVNITQESASDPSEVSNIESFITGDGEVKEETVVDGFITSQKDDNIIETINPFLDNTLGADRKRGATVDSFVTNQQDDNTTIGVNPIVTADPKLADDTNIDTFVTVDDEGRNEQDIIFDQNSLVNNKTDINISDAAIQAAADIIDFANKTPRRQKQLEILLYNAIPYGITQKIFGLISVMEGITNGGSYSSLFGSGQLNVTDIASAAFEANRIINNIKYLSATEIAFYVTGAVNFYTIQFRRGITIKDMRITPPFGPGIPFTVGVVERALYASRRKLQPFGTAPSVNPNRIFYETVGSPKDFVEDQLPLKTMKAESGKRDDATEITINVAAGTQIIDMKSISIKTESNPEYTLNNDDPTLPPNSVSFNDMQRKLRDKDGVWEVGSIYVWPIAEDGTIAPKWIPFQFNPTITEAGMAARYTATTILNRIGNLQSFTGTDNLTVSLNTAYVPISRNENDPFNIRDIQLIELGYRSLTLPWFSETTQIDGYRYYKPPLIKVIMGHKDYINKSTTGLKTTNSPYSNLLTYPTDVLNDKISGELRHFKTFIATSCAITRDDNMPYFMDKIETETDGERYLLKDTFGYNISMNLTEITPSYHQIFPNFKDYFSKSNPKFGSATT